MPARILDALPAHVAVLDHDGVIVIVNAGWRAFAAANGMISDAAAVGDNYLTVCDRASGEHASEASAAAAGIREVLAGQRSQFAMEYSCASIDQRRWFRLMVTPLGGDEPLGAVVMHINITERMLAEEARSRSEAALRSLADELATERERLVAAQSVAHIGSWETDLRTRALTWSDETHRIFETEPARFAATHEAFLDRVHPEDRDTVDAAFRASINADGPNAIEHRIVMPDGSSKIVEERWRVFRSADGTPERALGTCQDLTERKALEQQFLRAQRMESVGFLAGGIAHDLNNMLAPIMMAVDLLKDEVTGDDAKSLLTTLEQSAERGAELVRQVLSFARGAQAKRTDVNVLTVARSLVKVLRDTLPKTIDLQLTADSGLWLVHGDATQVHQVLLNLCVNARDAMPHGGTLTIHLGNLVLDEIYATMNADAKAGPHVRVSVSDTGTGIPPEVRDRIFEPFFTMKEAGKGTGLGLSTTAAIVKGHGGFIAVETEVGVGTRFDIYFPVDRSSAPVAAEVERQPSAMGRGELVLVVDDELAIRGVAERILDKFGYRVMLAAHGAEAVSLFAQYCQDIAVVVTDMAMPVMDGPATINALMAIDPTVKIIGSSGWTDRHAVTPKIGAAVREFVTKPYTAGELLAVVRRVLDQP